MELWCFYDIETNTYSLFDSEEKAKNFVKELTAYIKLKTGKNYIKHLHYFLHPYDYLNPTVQDFIENEGGVVFGKSNLFEDY